MSPPPTYMNGSYPEEGSCVLCREPITLREQTRPIGTPHGMRKMHTECSLREVMGGIGHLIAHQHWCVERHDPDAGLTYRQSAQLCWTYVEAVGLEAASAAASGQ